MPDDQVLREAVVQLPASPSEALFYHFPIHSSLCPSTPTRVETLTYHLHCAAAHEFPRIVFAGNSSHCIKPGPSKYITAIRQVPDTLARGVCFSKLQR